MNIKIVAVILLVMLVTATGTVAAAQYSTTRQSGDSMVHTYNSDDSGAGRIVLYTVKPGTNPQIQRGNAIIPRTGIINPRLPVDANRYPNGRQINRPFSPIPTRPITEGKALSFETIPKGHGGHNERGNYVIVNNSDWENVWDKMNSIVFPPKPSLPEIDFDRDMIIAVFQGWRSTGGYSIEVIKIIETENALEVFVKEVSPGPRCGVIQAGTHPCHIIKILKTDKEVIFRVNQEIISCQYNNLGGFGTRICFPF